MRIIATAISSCLALLQCVCAVANPNLPNVVHGQATFATPDPHTLSIENTPGAIINWQSFGIAANEITQFIQQGPNSAVLNRVVGTDPSALMGTLTSNGQVYLINPNGIVVGHNALIDTAGFVASTLDMTDEDFKRGHLHFEDNGHAGGITNKGFIKADDGGNILLVAPSITNEGAISTDGGNLILAAGHSVTITSLDDAALQFEIQAPDNAVINLGEMVVGQGAASIFAGTIQHAGTISANSLSVDAQGRIQLVAADDLAVADTAVVDASGANGGSIHIESVSGDTVIQGLVSATGDEQGGAIHVLGDRVGLFNAATVDASGHDGGGEVLIGGDFQGANPDISNASQTVVGDNAIIRANSARSGDGGTVIVWSDEYTSFTGRAEAKGGAIEGDGGFIEISGKESLKFAGEAAASAEQGAAGTVLFDPKNIDINDAGGAAVASNDEFSESPAASVQIDPADILGVLNGSDVVLQANNDITVTSLINSINVAANGRTLTLQAGRSIDILADISMGFGSLSLIANDPGAIAINRDPGNADIILRTGQTISTGTGFGSVMMQLLNGGAIGSVILEAGASIAPTDGLVSITTDPGGTITLNPGATITTGADVTLIADIIDLPAGVPIDADTTLGLPNTVLLAPATVGGSVALVATASGGSGATLELEVGDLQAINLDSAANDGILVVGNANTGDITVVDDFTPAGGGNTKDRVRFVSGSGSLNINGVLDGTGLSGANNGHSLEADIARDITIGATGSVDTGAANGLFQFGQDDAGASFSVGDSAIISPSFTVSGGAGVDALIGSSLADIYTFNAANGGTFDNANTSVLAFNDIENANADGGNDQFVIQTGGSLTGFIDGGAGDDHLDYSALTSAIDATVANVGGTDGVDINEATIAGGITNINEITAGSAATDTVTGLNGANTWAISPGQSAAVYQSGLGVLNVDGFETFTGGSAADSFAIGGVDGAVLQNLDGGAGSDTVQFAGNIISVAQTLSNVETLSIAASDVTIDTALSLDTLTMLGGSLAGTAGGDINISTGFNITAFGTPATITTTRTIQLLGGSSSSFLVDSTGAINFTGFGSLVNNGTINLNFGAGDGTATFASTYGFSNPGSLTVHDGTLAFGGAFVNAGTILLNQTSANLNTTGSFTNNGFLGGLGTVTATAGLVNNGTIDPGVAAIGQLNVVGDISFTSGSILNVEITSGLSSDVLNVTGNVALNTGAILDVSAIGGYTGGGGGDSFSGVIAASGTLGGTSGQFDTVMQPLGFSVADVYTAGPAGDLTLTSSTIAFNQWIGGALGDWDIAANWSLGLPGAADDVLIDTVGAVVTHDSGTDTIATLSAIAGVTLDITGGVLNISSASTIEGDINIAGGTLNANAPVTHNGSFTWTTGNLSATGGLTLAGVTTISGGTKTLSSSTLEHGNASGSSVLSTSQLNLDNSTFLNTGSLDVDTSGGDVLIDQDFAGPGIFENQGTITKIGAGRMDFFNAATLTFNNSGTLDIQTGDIFLRNTTSILNGNLNGPGRLIWDSGSVQINLSLNALSTFEISSGNTHTLTANSSVNGAGTLEWLGGTISSSNLDLTVNTPLVMSTADVRLSSTDLIHTNSSGSSLLTADQLDLDNATFQNAAGAILVVNAPLATDTVFIDQDFTAPSTFVNDGTITKTGAGSLEFFSGATLDFINTGTLDIQAGDISIDNTSTQISGSISGGGKLIWGGGSLEGTINLAAGSTFEVTGTAHTLTANTTINGPGIFHWDSGTISSGGLDLILNAPMTTSASNLRLSSTDIFHNDNSGASILATGQLDLDASEFTNSVGSILELSAPLATDTLFIDQDFTAAGAFRNFGTLNKTGLGRLEFFSGATLAFENTGTIDIQAGDVFVNNTSTILNGTLMGSGPLIWNSGTLQASLNIAAGAALEISGSTHTLSAASTLSGGGTVTWLAGTIQSNDLTVSTPLFITGTSGKRFSSGNFIHTNAGGLSTLDSTGNLDLDNAEFRNTGVLIVDSTAGTVFIDQDFTAGSLFNNQGTLTKIGAGQLNVFSGATLTFENSGTLDVQAGEIFIDNTSILNGNLTGAGKIVWNNGSSSGNLSIASGSLLEISGGTHTFSSASSYSGAGTVRWLGGTISGADLTVDTVFEVTGASAKRQSSMTINHSNASGLSFLDSTGTWDLDNATFNNTGTFDVDSSAGTVFIDQDFTAGSFFNNQGTINKTGAGIFEIFSGGTVTFDNDGTLNIVDGEVAIDQPFTNDGLIDLTASAILSGGNAVFNNGATGTIQGVGTIVTPTAGLGNSGVLSPGNGSLGTLNVTGNLNFNSGSSFDVQLGTGFVSDTIVVSGNVTINSGAILDVTTTGGYAGNLADTFVGALSTGGTLTGAFDTINQPGFTVNPNYTIGPAGDMTLVVGGVFNNWTGAISNDWNTAGNWTLGVVPDGSHDVRINTVGQTINVGGTGTTIVNTLGVVAGSAVQFTGSNLQLNANSTVNGDLQIGSTLTGGGDVISNGTFDFTGGALNGGGDIFINNLFNINNLGGAVSIGQVVNINSGGTAVWQAGAQNINATAGGSIMVLGGGAFDVQATNTIAAPVTIDAGGTLLRTSTAGVSTFSGGVVNNGAIDVQTGTLQLTGGFTDNGTIDIANSATFAVPAGFTQNGSVTDIAAGGTLDVGLNSIDLTAGGILSGNGTVNGNVNNISGVLSAGASPGAMLINGNYTQGPGGVLLVEVQNPGTTQGVDYDHITITGTAALDGVLQMVLLGGFVPAEGQLFDVLNYASASGAFSNIPDVDLSPGTQSFSGLDQGSFFQLSAGTAVIPIAPEPDLPIETPIIPTEGFEEPDLSEVIALEENVGFLETELEEEEEKDDETEYKVCSG